MRLSMEEVKKMLEGGSPILLSEGIHPKVVEQAVRHTYNVPDHIGLKFLPKFGGGMPPKNAIISEIPIVSMAERDPKKIPVTFRQMQ